LNSINPVVGIIMGSTSDWLTMKHTCAILHQFEIPFEKKVVSAHRSPQLMSTYAHEAKNRGLKVIIAGAGGAAHLPGMVAANTTLPVIGVPIQSKALNGMDSLLSIVQMPAGVPVATVAIGNAGAKNVAILATQILANENEQLSYKLEAFRNEARIKSERSSEELIDVE
jgi:5-(carboxyamino)imidazole ribonucleotide mutase